MSDAEALEAAEERVGHLLVALERRTVIGQAAGILMERYQIGPDAAFATLVRASQHTNRKVYDLAQELVSKGRVEGISSDK